MAQVQKLSECTAQYLNKNLYHKEWVLVADGPLADLIVRFDYGTEGEVRLLMHSFPKISRCGYSLMVEPWNVTPVA